MAIKISLDWKFNVQDFGIEIFFGDNPTPQNYLIK